MERRSIERTIDRTHQRAGHKPFARRQASHISKVCRGSTICPHAQRFCSSICKLSPQSIRMRAD